MVSLCVFLSRVCAPFGFANAMRAPFSHTALCVRVRRNHLGFPRRPLLKKPRAETHGRQTTNVRHQQTTRAETCRQRRSGPAASRVTSVFVQRFPRVQPARSTSNGRQRQRAFPRAARRHAPRQFDRRTQHVFHQVDQQRAFIHRSSCSVHECVHNNPSSNLSPHFSFTS